MLLRCAIVVACSLSPPCYAEGGDFRKTLTRQEAIPMKKFSPPGMKEVPSVHPYTPLSS